MSHLARSVRSLEGHSNQFSERFISREFAAALKYLKPEKAPDPDSICPEIITHAEAALKSWLCGFLSSCLRLLKIPKVGKSVLVVAIP